MSNNERVFFLHFRKAPNGLCYAQLGKHAEATGGATVAYTYDEKGVKYAVAKVSKKDRYEKSVGRKVSSERLGTEQQGYFPGSVNAFRRAMAAGLNGI